MPNVGLPELVIVLVIALVVFGPKRLPQMGRQLGKALREFREATSGLRSELGVDEVADAVNDVKSSFSLSGDQSATATSGGTAADGLVPEPEPLVGEIVDHGPEPAPEPIPPADDAEFEPEPAGGATATGAEPAPAGFDGAGI